jgi:hypothetical protein
LSPAKRWRGELAHKENSRLYSHLFGPIRDFDLRKRRINISFIKMSDNRARKSKYTEEAIAAFKRFVSEEVSGIVVVCAILSLLSSRISVVLLCATCIMPADGFSALGLLGS